VSNIWKRPESVLVVIYTVAGEVLLLERQQPTGYWQSVTGSLEWGEAAREAAVREVEEETGMRVSDQLVDCEYRNRFRIHPAWRSRYSPDVGWNIEHVFRVELAEIVPIQINEAEHRQAVWVSARQAARQVSSHTNRTAIERCLSC
jgi:dATP pyrophosphohydrolase